MLHEDRNRAGSFGTDAERYDRARPRYPDALYDRLLADEPRTALDVGCGTGIASRALAARGLYVLGLEPDPRMADVARAHGTLVEIGTFENWDPAGRTFDLVVAAQSWHWVHPQRGAAAAVAALTPGGRFGAFWNVGRLPPTLRASFERVYARHAPKLFAASSLFGSRGGSSDATVEVLGGVLSAVEHETVAHVVAYTTAEWLATLQTHSNHADLRPAVREALLAEVAGVLDAAGGGFEMTYAAELVTGVYA